MRDDECSANSNIIETTDSHCIMISFTYQMEADFLEMVQLIIEAGRLQVHLDLQPPLVEPATTLWNRQTNSDEMMIIMLMRATNLVHQSFPSAGSKAWTGR